MCSLASRGEIGGFSMPNLYRWQDHLLHPPRAPKCPTKNAFSPRPKALATGHPASEHSASGTPHPGPPACGQTSSYWTSWSWISNSWTSSSCTTSPTAAPMGASPAREGLIEGKPKLTQKIHRCCRLCKLIQNQISSGSLRL